MASDRWRPSSEQLRAATRFAIAIVITDAVLLAVYGETIDAALGSFAVIINLYFLDFSGSFRERLTGTLVATGVGAAGITLGAVVGFSAIGSVVAAFIVAAVLCYLRILHGYVAKAAVGMAVTFFLPVMIAATPTQIPNLLGAWLLGSVLAGLGALFLLPHRRSGRVRDSLHTWLQTAASLTDELAQGQHSQVRALQQADDALQRTVYSATSMPGMVGTRQRALARMVEEAGSAQPVAELLVPSTAALTTTTSTAFASAATLVSGAASQRPLPDLAVARSKDLNDLAGQPTPEVLAHYPIRLMSLIAMSQLWLAGVTRGVDAPKPDVGDIRDSSPRAILVADLNWQSVWMRNALRTGLGAAGCVLLVRALGLDHGLWVVLAALACLQGAFSASASWRSLLHMAAGSAAGVLVAGALLLMSTPRFAFLILLPLSAFAAKLAKERSLRVTQFAYAPFALINLAVLEWPPDVGMGAVRVIDIILGATVAAVVTLLVYPSGAGGLIFRLQATATDISQRHLAAQIAAARGERPGDHPGREACTRAIAAFEHALEVGYITAPSTVDPVLQEHQRAVVLARDRLVGADECTALAARRDLPGMAGVCDAIASWWAAFLKDSRVV